MKRLTLLMIMLVLGAGIAHAQTYETLNIIGYLYESVNAPGTPGFQFHARVQVTDANVVGGAVTSVTATAGTTVALSPSNGPLPIALTGPSPATQDLLNMTLADGATQTVTVTARDAAGNTGTSSFTALVDQRQAERRQAGRGTPTDQCRAAVDRKEETVHQRQEHHPDRQLVAGVAAPEPPHTEHEGGSRDHQVDDHGHHTKAEAGGARLATVDRRRIARWRLDLRTRRHARTARRRRLSRCARKRSRGWRALEPGRRRLGPLRRRRTRR